MIEVHVDPSEITRLVERLEQAPQVLAKAKRQAFTEAAPKLKAAVDAEIGGSGRVRSWQEKYVGSGGGYAAVRPRAKTFAEDRKGQPTKYAVGYVTRAINNGRLSRRDEFGFGHSKAVGGKLFYQRAQEQAETVAQEAAGEIVQALAAHLEG